MTMPTTTLAVAAALLALVLIPTTTEAQTVTTAAPSAAASPSPSNYANTTTSEEEEEGEHTLKGTIAMIMVGGAAVVCCLCCCLPSLCCQYAKEKKEVKILDQIIREHNQEVQHAIAGENPEAVAAFEKARKQWDRDAEKAAKGLKFLRLIRALLQIPKCILGLAGRVLLQLFQIVILMYSLAEWKGTNPFADIDQALAYVSKALEMISGPLGAPLGIISYWIRYVLSYLDISGLLKQYTDGRCTGLADAVALTLLLYSIQNILPWLTRKDFLLRANQEAIRLAADSGPLGALKAFLFKPFPDLAFRSMQIVAIVLNKVIIFFIARLFVSGKYLSAFMASGDDSSGGGNDLAGTNGTNATNATAESRLLRGAGRLLMHPKGTEMTYEQQASLVGKCGEGAMGMIDTSITLLNMWLLFPMIMVIAVFVSLPGVYGSMYTRSESIMSHSASSDGKAKIKESGILPERLSISEGYRNLVYSTLGIWDMRADVAYKIRLRAKRYALDNHDLTISSTIKQNMLVFTVLASPFISVVGAKLNSPAFYVHGGLCTSDLKTKSWVPPWIMRKVKWLCAAADLAGLSLILFMPSQLTAILAIVLVIPSWLAGVLSEYSSVFAGYRSAQQQKVMASLGISLSGINAEAAEAAAQALAAVKTMSETAARAAQDAVQKGVAAYSDTFQETVSSKESPGPDDYLEAHGAGIEAAKAAFSGTAAAASPKQQAKAKAAKELCKFAEDLKKTLHPEIMEACKREETCQVVFDGPWSKKAEKLVEIMVGKGVNKMAQVFSDKAGLGNLSLKQHKLSSLGIPGLKDTKEGKALTKVLPKEAGDDE